MPEEEFYRIKLDEFYELPQSTQTNLLENKTVVIRDGIVHIFRDVEVVDEDALTPKDMF